MDDLTSSTTENVEPSPKRRRTFWLAAGVIAILGAIFLLLRQSPGEEPRTAKADGVFAPGVIEATPEQLKQIRIEPVREQTLDLNLEATGKVAFNEDRLTPVLASYPGRVLEVRASTGDAVSLGQPLLVVERKVGLGQYVKPDNADPLFLIGDLSTVWITVDIYETDLSRVRIGAPVDIRVVAYPDRNFPARIAAINPTVDAATRTVRVRCLVPNLNGVLKPEMFARVRIGD